jgi:hypothetical protein
MKVRDREEWLLDRYFEIRNLIKVLIQRCTLPEINEIDALIKWLNSELQKGN